MRELILAEIRRIAAEAKGSPPGVAAFSRQTGISMAQWRGKYWAKWGDALQEAGFASNEMQGRLDSDALLEWIARACVHYQRWPAIPEVQLFGRSVDGFPSYTTVEKRFLTRAQLLEAMRDFARRKGDGSLLALLPEARPKQVRNPSNPARTEGIVYLLRSGEFYKIGRSDEIERRVKEIRVALPEAATLIHSIRTDDPPGIEAYWHRRFADRRANGEWFRLTAADVAAVRRRTFQ